VLRRHLQNAVTKETRDGAYITKDGRNSPRKIDVAIAAVMAYERAMVNSGAAAPWAARW
jgi:phage terminase large subunit-like protein